MSCLLSRPISDHCGKVVKKITSDHGRDEAIMMQSVRIEFEDGTQIHLKVDWRGNEAYISEYVT